jgi:hypothetical protein
MSVPSLASNRVNALNLEIEELSTELNDLSHFVYTLSGSVQQLILNDLSDELYDLSGRTDLLETDLASLEIRVEGISEEVDVILPDVLGLSGRVEGLSGRVEGLSLELDIRQNDFAGLSGDLYILESQVLDLSSYVYNLPQSVPTLDGVLTAGNDANGLGILNAGAIDATSFLSSSGSKSANDTTLYLDSANGSTPGLTGTGGIIEAYTTLNASIPKNLLLNSQYGGNVGIRTTNPSFPLDVSGNSRIQTSRATLTITDNSGTGYAVSSNPSIEGFNNTYSMGKIAFIDEATSSSGTFRGAIQFHTQSANTLPERMRLTNAGFLGIGLTNPRQLFEVSGGKGIIQQGLSIGQRADGFPFGSEKLELWEDISQNVFQRWKTPAVGYGYFVGIKTSGETRHENLDPRPIEFYTTPSTPGARYLTMSINANRTISLPGYINGPLSIASGVVTSSSDIRVKKNVVPANDIQGLEIVNQIEPKIFTYNWEQDDQRHLGFIADELILAGAGVAVDGKKFSYDFLYDISENPEDIHDVKKTLKYNEDGTPMLDYSRERYKSVDTTALIAILIKSVQELSKEVEELKSRI